MWGNRQRRPLSALTVHARNPGPVEEFPGPPVDRRVSSLMSSSAAMLVCASIDATRSGPRPGPTAALSTVPTRHWAPPPSSRRRSVASASDPNSSAISPVIVTRLFGTGQRTSAEAPGIVGPRRRLAPAAAAPATTAAAPVWGPADAQPFAGRQIYRWQLRRVRWLMYGDRRAARPLGDRNRHVTRLRP